MPLVAFTSIDRHPDDPRIEGYNLEFPRPGAEVDGSTVEIVGWVLGRERPIVAVELALPSGTIFSRAPIDVRRDDVAAHFGGRAGAQDSGFFFVTSAALLANGAVELRAILADHNRVALATIHGQRSWREAADITNGSLVSIVVPCYNQARFLAEAIESAVGQTYPHLEIVVVDDGATDNTAEVAARYPFVRFVRQDNQGLSAARNTGIRHSNGDFLLFLDSDDKLFPRAVEIGLQALADHPDAAFAAGLRRAVTVDGTPYPDPIAYPVVEDAYLELLRRCFIYPPAVVLFRRSVLEAVGNFDPTVSACADYDLFLRIARDYPVHVHDHIVADYRKHGTNMTRRSMVMLTASVRVLRRQLGFTRDSPARRQALREGLRLTHECWGIPVAVAVRGWLQAGEWREAIRGLGTLLQYDPRSLVHVLRQPDHRRAHS